MGKINKKNKKKEKIKEEVKVEEHLEEPIEVKEEKKTKKANLSKNKKILIILASCICFVLALLLVITKTDIISNLLGENKGPALITSVTYQGKNKYQIESTSKFIVETKNIKKDDLNKYLAIEPAYNYTIETKGKNKFEITVDNIEANQIVNIDFVNNEKIDKKWAFQSSNDYGVSSVYPADKKSNVSVDSVIEVTFTHTGTDLDEFRGHFNIEPKVEGTFKVYGRTITFVPKEELKLKTNYTVTITKGLKLDEDEITNDYSFTFTTEGDDYVDIEDLGYSVVSLDKISTFKPNDPPKVALYNDVWGEDNEDEAIDVINKIVVEKFSNSNDFYKYITGTTTIKRDNLGSYGFHKYNIDTVELDKTLNEGYYLLNVYASGNSLMFSIPVQVNSLSAYLMSSERDIVVWVAKDGELAKGIEVSYENKKETTNSDGIAILRDISDGSKKLKYVKINSGSNYPVFVGIENSSLNNYPYGYIYTDRPLYKNTDQVKVWGYVPLTFFVDKVDLNKFSLKLEDKNIPIKVSDDGTFTATIDLNNYASYYYELTLLYNNTPIGWRYIDVENYQAQNYIYEINTSKAYMEAGKNLETTIKVKHVSGIPAVNKEITVAFDSKTYKGRTNTNGEVTFNIKYAVKEDEKGENVVYEELSILGTALDSEDYDIGLYIPVIVNKVYVSNEESSSKGYKANFNVLDLSKDVKDNEDILDSLKGSKFKGTVNVKLVEVKETRSSYFIEDEYTKEKEEYYNWSTDYENIVDNRNIDIDGVLDYKVDYEYKEAQENEYYSYQLYVSYKDSSGYESQTVSWLYSSYDDKLFSNNASADNMNRIPAIVEYGLGDAYDLYEYEIGNENGNYWEWEYGYFNTTYSVGDPYKIKLLDLSSKEVQNDNKILEIRYREKITSTNIKKTNDMDIKFDKSDIPGVFLTGAYYDGNEFYRTGSDYYKYKEEDSELKITISPNKKNYEPKEEVEVKIKVTDKNGNPVQANLNVSVVNEGVFNLISDNTGILSTIYDYRYFSSYTYSTYRNYKLYDNRGGAGAESGGGGRSNFGDTIYFDTITTNKKGEATVKFKLNDLITSFRITVHASTKDASVGSNYTNINSTLPLSIEFNQNAFVKSSDDLVISVSSLSPDNKKNKVKYTIEIPEINKKIEKEGIPGQLVYANFGKLSVGKYTVKINASVGKLKDSVEYPVEIIETSNEIKITTENNIKDIKSIKPTKNPIYVEVYPSYLSKYLEYLSKLRNYTDRLDTKIGYYKALEYEKDFYNTDSIINVESFDSYKYENKLRPLINAETDDVLTALSLYYTNYFDINSSTYYNTFNSEDYQLSRIKALLVLAAKREPVLVDLNDYEANSLDENVYKALAYIFLGDYDSAKDVYDKYLSNSNDEEFRSLIAIVETVVARDKAEKTINEVLDKKESDKYINFAIISYFENNQDELLHKEKVEVTYGKTKEDLVIDKYNVNKLVLYDKDMSDIKFKSKSDKINVSYYYVGKISELGDKVIKNITISTSGNKTIGNVMYLTIDLSKAKTEYGNIYVYLPANVSLADTKVNNKGAYIYKTNENKLIVSLTKGHADKINVPLVVKLPGKYTFESVILEENDKYMISNEVEFETK